MAVTIYQIAEAAGVSSSTVARVLRPGFVATRGDATARAEKIAKIAEELGYRPSARARALSTGKMRCIGLVYSNDTFLFEGVHSDIFLGVTRTLHVNGYHLAFCPLEDGQSWRHIIDEGRIDGAFVFQSPPEPVAEALGRHAIPVVMLGSDDDPELPAVVVDDFEGGRIAADHLLDLGHERVAFWVHHEIDDHCSIAHRIRGFSDAVQARGLEPSVYLHATPDEMRCVLFQGDRRPTALVCYCDYEALIVQQMLWREGKRSPDDLSVVAFNDKQSLSLMTPPLTTVGFDAVQIGCLGADMMLSCLDESRQPIPQSEPEKATLSPSLIVRESTAPVQQGAST